MRRSLAGALLALMLAAALICPAWGEDFRPLLENRPLTAGDSVSDWLAVASGRAGLQRPDYLRDLESYVTSMYRENGGLDRIKATEWHRITLAVQAQGVDPTAFGRVQMIRLDGGNLIRLKLEDRAVRSRVLRQVRSHDDMMAVFSMAS